MARLVVDGLEVGWVVAAAEAGGDDVVDGAGAGLVADLADPAVTG